MLDQLTLRIFNQTLLFITTKNVYGTEVTKILNSQHGFSCILNRVGNVIFENEKVNY